MFTCPKCGQTFLQKRGYEHHASEHQQTHIDTWSGEKGTKDISKAWDMPQGLKHKLFNLFERYDIGSSKAILCLWKNGQLNIAIRPVEREHELMERLREWSEKG